MGVKCEFCGNLFHNQHTLATHQRTAKYCLTSRDIVPEEHTCGNCGKIFTTKFNLSCHAKKCEYIMPEKIKELIAAKDLKIQTQSAEIEELKTKLEDLKIENVKLASEVKADIYHEEYLALRDKPTTATYNNNTTTNKLKLVKTDTIDPFTIETIRARLANNEYTYDAYMSGLNGVKRFIMKLITKNDEKNYVTTDISRKNFFRFSDQRTWTGDKGAMFLNQLFDEMKPKIQEHWEKFKIELAKDKTLSETEALDEDLERVKPYTVAILAQSDAKPRLELLDDIIKHIKPRVAI